LVLLKGVWLYPTLRLTGKGHLLGALVASAKAPRPSRAPSAASQITGRKRRFCQALMRFGATDASCRNVSLKIVQSGTTAAKLSTRNDTGLPLCRLERSVQVLLEGYELHNVQGRGVSILAALLGR
jgi:hypothetical protein